MKPVTKYQISASIVAEKKCDEKWAYIFNVYKNQQSRQTGSRNLTGPKTLLTIWYTYMTLVTKNQISAINSYWEKCDDGQSKTVYPPPPSGSGGIIKWWQLNIWPNFKVHGPSQLKIIGLERNVSLICNSSLYTRIPKIKSISPRIAKKSGDNYIFGQISKSKGHNSAKNHCTGTERNVNLICNLSLY
jgi:hypothetical protein